MLLRYEFAKKWEWMKRNPCRLKGWIALLYTFHYCYYYDIVIIIIIVFIAVIEKRYGESATNKVCVAYAPSSLLLCIYKIFTSFFFRGGQKRNAWDSPSILNGAIEKFFCAFKYRLIAPRSAWGESPKRGIV